MRSKGRGTGNGGRGKVILSGVEAWRRQRQWAAAVGSALLLVLFTPALSGQELNCKVEITSAKLQTADPKIFQTLKTSVYEFMNNRKWTNDNFRMEERIECSMFINVTEETNVNVFKAQVNVQSSRPVFNSDYQTVLLNHIDKEWVFEYTEFQPLDFNENDFISNLTSMLAYYAYLIIGLDYDCYSLNSGTPFYQKAQTIVNTVPSNLSSDIVPGWKPFDNDKNRYWIIDNLLNVQYAPLREALYLYHRKGLDVMYDNPNNGRQVILNSLSKVGEVAEEYPNAIGIKLFFNAKNEEIVNIFAGAPPNEKAAAVQILYKADPSNNTKYAKIMK